MLQLHKSTAAKIGSGSHAIEQASSGDFKARSRESKTGIQYIAPYDKVADSPVSELLSGKHGHGVAFAGHTKSSGESVRVTSKSSASATDSFHSDKCQRFYLDPAPPGYPWGAGAHDSTTNMFRPATEIEAKTPSGGGVKRWPEVAFKRMVTYEDVVAPIDYHGDVSYHEHNHCMHYAVRTPQRPVKTMAGTGRNGRTFAMPAVWKSGSTSFNTMLRQSTTDFHPEHSDNGRSSSCKGPFELPQCDKHSSFDSSGAELMFAAVRNPLKRFISSIKEHQEFRICDGHACAEDIQLGMAKAARLLSEFPYLWNSCEHATQSYLLSGTDIEGNPMSFQRIIRLEELDEGLHEIESMLDQTFDMDHRNSKDREAKKLLYDAVFSDLATLCAICKVYAQDFECFGYAMPDNCTEEQCASVGVMLKASLRFGEGSFL
jgi:hypothetical protein